MSWTSFLDAVEAGDDQAIKTCLWGRSRVQSNDCDGVSGVGRVFVGHTTQEGVKRLGNVYHIDTAAVFGEINGAEEGWLTMAGVTARTEVLVSPRKASSLVDLRNSNGGISAPFDTSMMRAHH